MGSVATTVLLLAAASLFGVALSPRPLQAADSEAGRTLAAVWCANCHRVASAGPGPITDAAPSFAAIAANPATTADSLRVFLQMPHAAMPDYRLTRGEIEDIIAYLLSLRR